MQLKNHEKIVFTGDSVTDAGRKFPFGEGLGEGVGRGYVRQIDNMLNVVYPDYHFHIVNTGTSEIPAAIYWRVLTTKCLR